MRPARKGMALGILETMLDREGESGYHHMPRGFTYLVRVALHVLASRPPGGSPKRMRLFRPGGDLEAVPLNCAFGRKGQSEYGLLRLRWFGGHGYPQWWQNLETSWRGCQLGFRMREKERGTVMKCPHPHPCNRIRWIGVLKQISAEEGQA